MTTVFEMIWRFLKNFFVNSNLKGELTVVGTDEARFELPERPEWANVQFEDDTTTPCNPGTDDMLDWDIKRIGCGICCSADVCSHPCRVCNRRKHWVLVIKWKVAGVRKIVWEVCS